VSEGTDYEFEWDDAKAAGNLAKHGVAFVDAMSVLLDPLAMTRFDTNTTTKRNAESAWDARRTGSHCWWCIRSLRPGRTRRWCA
jgi:Uncharacterized protein conserved in bacteria